MNKLSAGQIASLIFYRQNDFSGKKVSDRQLKDGSWIHQRLGYNQEEVFVRYYYHPKTGWWKIVGVPDKIIEEEGVVEELKTYITRKDWQSYVGKVQLMVYLWLTGFTKGRVVLYSMNAKKITEKQEYEFDKKFFKIIMDTAISLELKIREFRKNFEKAQEKIKKGGIKNEVDGSSSN